MEVLRREDDMEKVKYCSKCDKIKEVSLFHKNRSNHDGLADHCKECVKKAYQDRQRRRKEEKNKPYPVEGYANLKDTADFLGLSDVSVRRMRKRDELPKAVIFFGGKVMFDAREIREWAKSKTIK